MAQNLIFQLLGYYEKQNDGPTSWRRGVDRLTVYGFDEDKTVGEDGFYSDDWAKGGV